MSNSQNRSDAGFSLIELAVILVVLGVIMGIVSAGKDVVRSAEFKKIYARHIQAWSDAYSDHIDRQGVVVGDDADSPTLKVNGIQGVDPLPELCDTNAGVADELHAYMDAAGIEMPSGRAEGREDRYVYQDTNGNPQEVQICFLNTDWSDQAGVSVERNVMVIKGLEPALARSLDTTIDGRPDARFGLFRLDELAGDPSTTSAVWPADNRDTYGTTSGGNLDEDQIAVMTAYYRMSQ
ncbi:MAG: prepilin-type N-terminal cleavage/methylation domain-containing protein [Magnetococcales bacterium]|nr:prepilin-type N-terminal cleavage/methylation domain-containing protein [Magnetococcales bacterium]